MSPLDSDFARREFTFHRLVCSQAVAGARTGADWCMVTDAISEPVPGKELSYAGQRVARVSKDGKCVECCDLEVCVHVNLTSSERRCESKLSPFHKPETHLYHRTPVS